MYNTSETSHIGYGNRTGLLLIYVHADVIQRLIGFHVCFSIHSALILIAEYLCLPAQDYNTLLLLVTLFGIH